MAPQINTGSHAVSTLQQLTKTQSKLVSAMERLSSTKRASDASGVNAGQDVAGMVSAQFSGANQTIRNAYDGVSLSQTAGEALSASADMLQRLRGLAAQSSDPTTSGRQALQAQAKALTTALDDVARTASFGGTNLFDGTAGAQTLQASASEGDTFSVGGRSFLTSAYGNNRLASVPSAPSAIETGAGSGAASFTIQGQQGAAT
ncbi:MAG: hypothetical protein LBK01_00200, partial [Burkholderiaceae bacterium]|nr:hypothetical protein [Burkholderiaceae bacterium]